VDSRPRGRSWAGCDRPSRDGTAGGDHPGLRRAADQPGDRPQRGALVAGPAPLRRGDGRGVRAGWERHPVGGVQHLRRPRGGRPGLRGPVREPHRGGTGRHHAGGDRPAGMGPPRDRNGGSRPASSPHVPPLLHRPERRCLLAARPARRRGGLPARVGHDGHRAGGGLARRSHARQDHTPGGWNHQGRPRCGHRGVRRMVPRRTRHSRAGDEARAGL
ncbi:MAG: Pyrimidine-specific ribonucleoside hydrolase RihB, partial [uncultured Thermomicrobiales bacterium]